MEEDIDLIRVTNVDYVEGYTMDLEFSNGKTKRIDFLPLLNGKIFEPLKDMKNFIQFGLTHWTTNGSTVLTSLPIICISRELRYNPLLLCH